MIKRLNFFGVGLVFLFCTNLAWGQSISGVTGASATNLVDAKNVKIYGGYIEDPYVPPSCYSQPAGTSATCNTCEGGNCGADRFCACNVNGIHPNFYLIITGTTKAAIAGRTILVKDTVTTTNSVTIVSATATGANSYQVVMSWSSVCDEAGMSGCSTGGSSNAYAKFSIAMGPASATTTTDIDSTEKVNADIYIHTISQQVALLTDLQYHTECPAAAGSAGDGKCYYRISRGDGKVYLKDIGQASGYPTSAAADMPFTKLVFFGDTSGQDLSADLPGQAALIGNLSTATASYILDIDSDGESDNRIDGLSNDLTYCFIMANEDITGNIYRFQDPTAAAADPSRVCATPTLVEGLLDSKKCFIATAAYGSSMDNYVDLLRRFRTEYLLPTAWGKEFVSFYYAKSPKLAMKIHNSEVLRSITRLALWPLVGFAALSLELGLAPAILILISAILALVLVGRLVRIRMKARRLLQ